ncbi:hypothetical protein QZH41_012391 [Actinostola sp. cb2023]|nr:hypothetical protein QZH41_012391 [Actinostola sp. cb2023]
MNIINTRKYTIEITKRFPNITNMEIQSDLHFLSTYFTALSKAQSNGTNIRTSYTPQELASAFRFGSMMYSLGKLTHQLDDLLLPQELRPLLVHSPEEYPLVEDKGFVVAPGTHTLCSVRRKEIKSLPPPYDTNCGEKKLDLLKDTDYKYSQSACVKECLLSTIIKRCKCIINTQLTKIQRLPLCLQRNHLACIGSVLAKLETMTNYLTCQNECREACTYSEYEYKLSTARLNEKTLAIDTNAFCTRDKKDTQLCKTMRNKTEAEKRQYFRDNVLSLDVFLEDFNYEEFKQVPVYELFALISGIGGNLGLFLGMSLLTTAEFLDYLARTLWFKLRSPCRKKRVSATDNKDKLDSVHVSSFDNHEVNSGHVFQPEIYNTNGKA